MNQDKSNKSDLISFINSSIEIDGGFFRSFEKKNPTWYGSIEKDIDFMKGLFEEICEENLCWEYAIYRGIDSSVLSRDSLMKHGLIKNNQIDYNLIVSHH